MNWIDVNDRLPSKLEKVLFHCIYDGNLKNIHMGYLSDKGWNIYLPYSSFDLQDGPTKVTHWMPLPKFPYEE